MAGVRNGLRGEAELEAAADQIANQDRDEDGDEAPQQVHVLEHHRVTQTADHTHAGLLRQRADDEGDDKRDEKRCMLGAGAFWQSALSKLRAAYLALVDGGVKSYVIDDRELTRFDLPDLKDEIEGAEKKVDELLAER